MFGAGTHELILLPTVKKTPLNLSLTSVKEASLLPSGVLRRRSGIAITSWPRGMPEIAQLIRGQDVPLVIGKLLLVVAKIIRLGRCAVLAPGVCYDRYVIRTRKKEQDQMMRTSSFIPAKERNKGPYPEILDSDYAKRLPS